MALASDLASVGSFADWTLVEAHAHCAAGVDRK